MWLQKQSEASSAEEEEENPAETSESELRTGGNVWWLREGTDKAGRASVCFLLRKIHLKLHLLTAANTAKTNLETTTDNKNFN